MKRIKLLGIVFSIFLNEEIMRYFTKTGSKARFKKLYLLSILIGIGILITFQLYAQENFVETPLEVLDLRFGESKREVSEKLNRKGFKLILEDKETEWLAFEKPSTPQEPFCLSFLKDKLRKIIFLYPLKTFTLTEYERLKSMLTKKYGKPDPDKGIKSLSINMSTWEYDSISIVLALISDLHLSYTFMPLDNKVSERDENLKEKLGEYPEPLFYFKVQKMIRSKEYTYDFRKTHWGMTKKQVKSTEKGKIVEEDGNLLTYQGTASGLDCLILYIFADRKLVRTQYIFTETHTNKNDYISDYNTLKETLIKKYGKPIEDFHRWKNNLYKDDYQDWGFAISLGHLVYLVNWETPNTNIILALFGDNYDITLGIEYASKSLKELEEKAKEKKFLEEF